MSNDAVSVVSAASGTLREGARREGQWQGREQDMEIAAMKLVREEEYEVKKNICQVSMQA